MSTSSSLAWLPDNTDISSEPLNARQVPSLLRAFSQVTDPRSPQGRRWELPLLLGITVAAALAGHTSYAAIGEWARDLPPGLRLALGLGARRGPCEATIRFTLQRLDADELSGVIGGWLAARSAVPGQVRHIAVDGKTARGSRDRDKPAAHLLSAFDADSGVVLGQQTMADKPSEITAFQPLLESVDIKGAVVTADALHVQHAHVAYLAGRGADWAWTAVKANQPTTFAQIKAMPWADVPQGQVISEKSHGRCQTRSIKLCDAPSGFPLNGAKQVFRIIRRTRPMGTDQPWTVEVVYGATSLDHRQAGPARIAHLVRRHWSIEVELHWVRDVTFGEDLSRIRAGNGPAVMATIRNTAISLHRLNGAENIAAATRHIQRHPEDAMNLII